MKKFLVILTAVFFALLVLLNTVIFELVLSGPALVIACIGSWVVVGILTLVIASRYTHLAKASEGGDKGGKKESYLTRIWSAIIIAVLFWFGMSLVGGIVTFLIVTFTKNRLDSIFMDGAFIPLLMFAVYLVGLYKNFKKLGFQDAQKQKFNSNLKILTLLLLVMFVMPFAFLGNAYSTYLSGFFIDFRSVFSFKIDLTLVDDYMPETLTNANMVFVAAKALLVLAMEAAVAVFAYMRGKAVFIKQHIRQGDDYQTDETFTPRKKIPVGSDY